MIRFGPAGIPIQCKGSSTLEGVRCCAELGLTAMEMEFVQGVRMGEAAAAEVRKAAEETGTWLSSHAPYYVNLCSKDEAKIKNSHRHILSSARITALAGGDITVFHPGFYQKQTPEEAFATAKKNLKEIEERLKQDGVKIRLGAETVGKKSAFGGLLENIRLSQQLDMVEPAVDFAHLHARGDVRIRGADDYKKIFDLLEKELGSYVKRFHCHFSEIKYSDKGELNHLVLGTSNEPPFKPFMKVLAENGYSGTVICESPKLDIDALTMKAEYERLVKH
ncbi:MAG: TIM barrel protein [Candidatus ainarchaeum sp.]|nr:TIM barrel protein [Candidatus ainarchaeum sp.]